MDHPSNPISLPFNGWLIFWAWQKTIKKHPSCTLRSAFSTAPVRGTISGSSSQTHHSLEPNKPYQVLGSSQSPSCLLLLEPNKPSPMCFCHPHSCLSPHSQLQNTRLISKKLWYLLIYNMQLGNGVKRLIKLMSMINCCACSHETVQPCSQRSSAELTVRSNKFCNAPLRTRHNLIYQYQTFWP